MGKTEAQDLGSNASVVAVAASVRMLRPRSLFPPGFSRLVCKHLGM